jgi:membrane protease subunit HflC
VYLFSYQVPANMVGVVFTLGKFNSADADPGLKFKWPSPIQTVEMIDLRTRLFKTKKLEVLTRDKNNLNVTVSTGWSITDPKNFIEKLKTVNEAERQLRDRVGSTLIKAIGEFYLHDLFNQNKELQQQKYAQFEGRMKELLAKFDLEGPASDWGVKIDYLAVEQIIFPDDVSKKVFERMKQERAKESQKFKAQGESEAKKIISEADANAKKILAEAKSTAEIMKGKGDAEAAEHYKIFKENPKLAKYLREIKTLRKILASGKVTPILDPSKHAPFTLLQEGAAPVIGK